MPDIEENSITPREAVVRRDEQTKAFPVDVPSQGGCTRREPRGSVFGGGNEEDEKMDCEISPLESLEAEFAGLKISAENANANFNTRHQVELMDCQSSHWMNRLTLDDSGRAFVKPVANVKENATHALKPTTYPHIASDDSRLYDNGYGYDNGANPCGTTDRVGNGLNCGLAFSSYRVFDSPDGDPNFHKIEEGLLRLGLGFDIQLHPTSQIPNACGIRSLIAALLVSEMASIFQIPRNIFQERAKEKELTLSLYKLVGESTPVPLSDMQLVFLKNCLELLKNLNLEKRVATANYIWRNACEVFEQDASSEETTQTKKLCGILNQYCNRDVDISTVLGALSGLEMSRLRRQLPSPSDVATYVNQKGIYTCEEFLRKVELCLESGQQPPVDVIVNTIKRSYVHQNEQQIGHWVYLHLTPVINY